MVPVEYANQRLWGVTSEYENLLNIQKDQHALAAKQRQAEIVHLRSVVEMFETEQFDEDSVAARLRSKDEEATLSVQAKQKELELFASLLQLRDKQIGELQRMCESKQAQISALHQQRFPEFAGDGLLPSTPEAVVDELRRQADQKDRQLLQVQDELRNATDGLALIQVASDSSSREALAAAEKEVEALRREKADLEQLLVAKDKQLGAVSALDPTMSDSSALQLGAQAIQMFHDSMSMRAEASEREEEEQQLRAEAEQLGIHANELEISLAEKREEIQELASALAAKARRVAELEAQVEAAEKEKIQIARNATAELEDLQERIAVLQDEADSKQRFVDQLKDELTTRDRKVMDHQAEGVQQEMKSRRLEARVEEMSSQLANTEKVLAQMMGNSSYKDQLVREMAEQVNITETRLHSYQVQELMCARQKELENRANAPMGLSSGLSPVTPLPRLMNNEGSDPHFHARLSEELAQTRSKIGMISKELQSDASPWPLQRWPQAQQQVLSPLATQSNWSQCNSPQAPSYCSMRASGASGERGQPASVSELDTSAVSDSMAVGPPSEARRAGAPQALASVLLGQSYRPHPGDPVDARVAEFVNQPQNRHCKALFCRLGPGTYLYGTQRASLRVDPALGQLEAFDDNSDWISIGDFTRHMEKSQGMHLQRAREAAAAGAA